MNIQHSSRTKFLIFGDSHTKYISRNFKTSSYTLITKAVRGLKWVDQYEKHVSVYDLLFSSEIRSYLSQVHGICFVVGTNSIRIMSASQIISQIRKIIIYIRQKYPQLNELESVTIAVVFPCFKTSRRFATQRSLINNIHSYNQRLKQLSSEMQFNIIDFHIKNHHIANDNIHLEFRYYHRIFKCIINYFNRLIQRLCSNTTTGSIIDSAIRSTSE